jgi:hypothetical protein
MRLAAALALVFAAAPLAAAPLTAAPSLAPSEATTTQVVEWKRLKAKPGERANLAAFITANWFAMDAKAVEQGLFTAYRLIENPAADSAWDLLVEVGYPTAAGYDDPATQAAFTAIRAAHTTVRIEGKSLADLGTILGTERLTVLDGTR